ncbi:MAG: UDP-N-acetylmuramoyl-tripeptide--D-alanyl-D-alanine ligase [Bacteroidota bacterium]
MKNIEIVYGHFLKSSGICIDSRKAKPNEIFIALKGENFDGNEYAQDALKRGCNLAVVDRPEIVLDDRYFLVDNCLVFLQELARIHRDQLPIVFIGITGSNGKTTTKELMHAVLSRKFKTKATSGNLNNHIGVPLTILEIKDEEMAIIEMGANHPGEIDFLCRIAKPDYGIITNIGKAHLEGFGSFEGVKKTKSELYRYLNEKQGTIFINGSNKILTGLSDLENLQKVYYIDGDDPLCDGYILDCKEKLKIALKFIRENKTLEANVNLTGSYNLENILAAASIGSYFQVSPEEVIKGLESFKTTQNRSQFIKTEKNLVVSDAYNANPTSMLEAIDNFVRMNNSRKILVIGDMLELGNYSDEEHKKILEHVKKYDFNQVYLVGKEFKKHKNQFNFDFYASVSDLYEHFIQSPVRDNLILLKGSRGIALEKLLKVL